MQTDAEYNRQASLGRTDFSSKSSVDQALAARDANRANVVNAQAGVTLAAINLGYTQVTAPFDGVVTAHLVSVGSLVGANAATKLATIVQLEPIYVTFNISEQDVLRIRAMLRLRGPDGGRSWQGAGRGRTDDRSRVIRTKARSTTSRRTWTPGPAR